MSVFIYGAATASSVMIGKTIGEARTMTEEMSEEDAFSALKTEIKHRVSRMQLIYIAMGAVTGLAIFLSRRVVAEEELELVTLFHVGVAVDAVVPSHSQLSLARLRVVVEAVGGKVPVGRHLRGYLHSVCQRFTVGVRLGPVLCGFGGRESRLVRRDYASYNKHTAERKHYDGAEYLHKFFHIILRKNNCSHIISLKNELCKVCTE